MHSAPVLLKSETLKTKQNPADDIIDESQSSDEEKDVSNLYGGQDKVKKERELEEAENTFQLASNHNFENAPEFNPTDA